MDEKQLAEQYDGLLAAYNKVTAQLGTPSDDRDARALVAMFARIARISLQDAHLFVRDQARKSLEAESERFARSFPIDGMSRPSSPFPDGLPFHDGLSPAARRELTPNDAVLSEAVVRILRIARRLREGRKIRSNDQGILEALLDSIDPKPPSREAALRLVASLEREDQLGMLRDRLEAVMTEAASLGTRRDGKRKGGKR